MPKPTFDLIGETLLTSSQATITFDNLSSNYTDLHIIGSVVTTTTTKPYLLFNNSTSAIYNRIHVRHTATATTYSSTTTGDATEWFFGSLSNDLSSTTPMVFEIDINDYTNASYYKAATSRFFLGKSTVTSGTHELGFSAMSFESNTALTRLDFKTQSGSFDTNSIISVYGIKKE